MATISTFCAQEAPMDKQLTTIATLASVASIFLSSCSGNNTIAPSQSVPQIRLPHHRHTAAELGLWPRPGPAKRVCPEGPPGSVSCQSLVRTDIRARPDTSLPMGYAPSDLWTAYGIKPINMPGQTVANRRTRTRLGFPIRSPFHHRHRSRCRRAAIAVAGRGRDG